MRVLQHTPGPWEYREFETEKGVVFDISNTKPETGGVDVAYTYSHEANARLIAAAPELLADLQQAAATLRGYEALHWAKGTAESIAKAEVNAALAARFEATIARVTGGTV
jgi:hypothetical protein